jgi:hypothetical protein
MPRPKGSRNKAPATVKQVAVRLTADELDKLCKVHRSPSKAIKQLIAER